MSRFAQALRILFVAAVVLGLTACNTVAGVGKDVSKAGEAVEKAAERAKK